MSRREDGAAVVVATALTSLLVLFALVGGGAVGIVAAHRQAQAAADLAALAGAAATMAGKDPCAEVARVARTNGTEVRVCSGDGRAVSVVVERRPPGFLSMYPVRARARAGPAGG